MPDLIALRYPALHRARQAWRCGDDQSALAKLEGDGAARLRLAPDDRVTIVEADPRLEALYGRPLRGAAADLLSPDADIAVEATIAADTGCELFVEDTVTLTGGATRMARLYLPLAPALTEADVLCLVVVSAASKT